MANERELRGLSGWLVIFVILAIAGAAAWSVANVDPQWAKILSVAVLVLDLACLAGLTVVNPNHASVVTLFGVYKGSIKQSGFWWLNPLTTRRKLSLRVRNFESARLKVNERDGNPIEIAAVVVWRIIETFEAVFNVDDYENFVHVQSEAAVRNLATTYPYDSHEDGDVSLRLSAGEVAERMRHEIQDRLSKAGIEVIEARISHLAYAPAGDGHRCGTPENRRGRRGHGRNGARRNQPQERGRARRRAQGRDGEQSAGGTVQ
jgi:regulator of protease activity HflC (stomatin/prohibitin superfamily)